MSDVKVSIVVPVYNTEEYLAECIKSICQQTLKELEILLIDDGSKADCGRLCDDLAEQDTRIRVFHQVNGGVSKARNKGIAEARGEYIGFVDSDDYIEKDMYEILYHNANEYDADISCVLNKVIMDDGRVKDKPESEEVLVWSKKEEFIYNYLKPKYLTMGAYTKIFRKDKYSSHFFDERFKINEDKLFVFQALMKANKVVFQAKTKYHYYRRENSSSISNFSEKYFDIAKIGDIIIDDVSDTLPTMRDTAVSAEISANLRMLKLLIQRNGLEQYKEQFEKYRKELIGYSAKFCKKTLKRNDFIRWYILRLSKGAFVLFTKTVDHD